MSSLTEKKVNERNTELLFNFLMSSLLIALWPPIDLFIDSMFDPFEKRQTEPDFYWTSLQRLQSNLLCEIQDVLKKAKLRQALIGPIYENVI